MNQNPINSLGDLPPIGASDLFSPYSPVVDVIIPVYRGLQETQKCLESVLAYSQTTMIEVVVINDCSPDEGMDEYLEDLARDHKITLLKSPINVGFVNAVNRGMALHPERDVILLNSDTEVSGDWLDRLVRCAYINERIGTVTPFSNNATICSYPRFCEQNDLPDGLSLADIDALFRRANLGRWVEIPTAVGFCMYIRRACLAAVGYFDEHRFGLGYGEENDFCMRASEAGWRHALCADTFVYHIGSVSFSDRAVQLQAQAQDTLAVLHPEYPARIQDFIRQDPARPLRLAVDQERVRFSPEQALRVMLEQHSAVADLWRRQTALEQGLREAERLLAQAQHELRIENQALTEAQHYVRERETDIVRLQEESRTRQEAFQQAQEKCVLLEQQIETLQQYRLLNAPIRQPNSQACADSGIHNLALHPFPQTIMNETVHLFTSITANYLPKARVLADSAKRQGLDIRFHVLLCDDYPMAAERDAEPFDSIIDVRELPIPDRESWLFGHTVVEMCTAVKAMGFLEIARRFAAEKIFYFDPDMVILGGLDGLIERLNLYSILLTPHQTMPERSMDAVIDNEIGSLKYGVFNLGFLGVRTSEEGLRFLNWWAERLRYFCHDDIAGGLFTDQRWIDLAPAFFQDIEILREPVYNVATWNLTHRRAAGSLEYGITINDQPLSFYHFSGFDGGAQEIMLKKYADRDSVLFDFRRWYVAECQRMGQEQLGYLPCRYHSFDNGEPITKAQRILYRSRLDLQRAFPHPFQIAGNSYYRWYQLNGPGIDGGAEATDEASIRAQLINARRELDMLKRSRSWRLAQVIAGVFNTFR